MTGTLAWPAILLLVASLGTSGPEDPSASRPLEPEESLPEEAAAEDSLGPAVLCARAEHQMEDGGREALVHARDLFQAAVTRHPGSSCGHAGLARALTAIVQRAIEQDDALITRAVTAAREAVRLEPSSPVAQAALAFALLADLQPDEAARAAETAITVGPDSHQAWHAAAVTRLTEGRVERARDAALQAIRRRPDIPALRHVLGNTLLVAGRVGDAIDAYLEALVLCPDHLPSRFQLAVALERAGSLKESAAILQQVMDRHPEDAGLAHLYMAISLIGRNSPEAALAVLDRATFANARGIGAGTVRYYQGLCLEMLDRHDEAARAYKEIVERFPDATIGASAVDRLADHATLGQARLLFAQGKHEEAAAVMDQGARRAGAGADLLLRMARLYEDYKMPERAMPLLETGCSGSLSPRSAQATLESCIAWGRLARRSNDKAALARLARTLGERGPVIDGLEDVVHDLSAMRALCVAGYGKEAEGWLRRAVGRGYTQLAWIQDDPELAPVHEAARRATTAAPLSGGADGSP